MKNWNDSNSTQTQSSYPLLRSCETILSGCHELRQTAIKIAASSFLSGLKTQSFPTPGLLSVTFPIVNGGVRATDHVKEWVSLRIAGSR